jgi:hypothetical protein
LQDLMRTQAKPFIVQIKKRKRTGADEPRPVRSLFGPVAKELANEMADADSSGSFGRAGDGGCVFRGGAQSSAASSAWPSPANGPAAPASPAARVLPDLTRHDRVEPEVETEEVVKREPRIRRKRRYTRKAAKTAGPATEVVREQARPPAPAPVAAVAIEENSGEAQKRVRRQRFKWSAWRGRRGKTDGSSPGQPPRGQRWKRRLPRAAR